MRLAAILAAVLFVAPDAGGDQGIPVYLQVTGSGFTHVVVKAGDVLPCDSLSNALVFDGVLEANRSYVVSSPLPTVCERHTYGAFRQAQWSDDRYFCAWGGHWWFDVPISTDE